MSSVQAVARRARKEQRARTAASLCGYRTDCTRSYSLSAINESAAAWRAFDFKADVQLRQRHSRARQECWIRQQHSGLLLAVESGAWCLGNANASHETSQETSSSASSRRQSRRVELPNGMSYTLPPGHVAADDTFARALHTSLDGQSLNDFGAGVGQYGRALLSLDPAFAWRGYDGAGDVEVASDGFVGFFDLTLPTLSLPRADWVMSLEVVEHVPHENEFAVIRNLHAHNTRGMILSWGALGQPGVSHVNNHNQSYVSEIFEQLGYHRVAAVESALRHAAKASPWLSRNVLVLERVHVLSTSTSG